MSDKTNQIASTLLGKKVSYSDEYNPSLLVAVPRSENRKQYNIQNDSLPLEGWDVWHAYEFSSMSENGVPVTRLMKLKYNCTSEFIIESKSLKLYLNSFNMTRYGKSIKECLEICKNIIEKDLSEKLQTEFKESPELIEVEQYKKTEEYFLMFDSLRSNCRVTHQPDFGDVFIYYKSSKHIKENSLVKYLSSFRSEYHFHEECCEMIYKRLYDLLDRDDELFVCALYTRRGGIDICPSRHSKNCNIVDAFKLTDTSIYARKSIKQ